MSILADQKRELPTVLPQLKELWETATPGQIITCRPTDAWYHVAAPPWCHVEVEGEGYDVVPMLPARWLKRYVKEPGPRARPDTLTLWTAGQNFLAAAKVRMDEPPPSNWPQHLQELLAQGRKDFVAIDLETTGLDPDTCEIVGVAIAVGNEKFMRRGYFPFDDFTAAMLRRFWEHNTHPIIGWNSLFDQRFLNKNGVPIKFTDDVKILAWLTNIAVTLRLPTGGEEGRAPSLKETATAILGVKGVKFEDVLKAYEAEDIRGVPWLAQAYYAGNDAEWTLRLYFNLKHLQDGNSQRWPKNQKLYNMELDLFPVTEQMMQGMRLDLPKVSDHILDLRIRRKQIVGRILDEHGLDIDTASDKEKREAVYHTVAPQVFTKKKALPAMDKKTLATLKTPLTKLMLELAGPTVTEPGIDKLLNTYLIPWAKNNRDGWVKFDWRSYGTWSGRYSGTGQQIPSILHDCFLPDDDDSVLVVADYGQLELRIAACLSGDERMIEMLDDPDPENSIHLQVQRMLNLPSKVLAKNFNFGRIYGAEPITIAERTDSPLALVKKGYADHEKLFPDLMRFRSQWIKQCKVRGYSTTMGGLVRLLPDLRSFDWKRKAEAERQGFNHLIQGSAGWIVKQCMLDVQDVLNRGVPESDFGQKRWGKVRLLAQVHDELIYSVPKIIAPEFKELLQECGERDILDPVKLVFLPQSGKNWKVAKDGD